MLLIQACRERDFAFERRLVTGIQTRERANEVQPLSISELR